VDEARSIAVICGKMYSLRGPKPGILDQEQGQILSQRRMSTLYAHEIESRRGV
jgi:hypothetical protein